MPRLSFSLPVRFLWSHTQTNEQTRTNTKTGLCFFLAYLHQNEVGKLPVRMKYRSKLSSLQNFSIWPTVLKEMEDSTKMSKHKIKEIPYTLHLKKNLFLFFFDTRYFTQNVGNAFIFKTCGFVRTIFASKLHKNIVSGFLLLFLYFLSLKQ